MARKSKQRIFQLEGSQVSVKYIYDEKSEKYIGLFPNFEGNRRCTSKGMPWVSALQESCNLGTKCDLDGQSCPDCGSCKYYKTEQAGDPIGICMCKDRRVPLKNR